jgi:hypothetical protein
MRSFFAELWLFLKERKKYWLIPAVLALVLLGILAVLVREGSIAPFVYSVY